MKRKIIAALIATLAITQAGIGFTGNMGKVHAMNPNQYTDVVSTNVNYSYIEKMVDEGIMDAETENEFGAEKAMTRQGLLTALYRMEKNPLVLDGENTFADVDYKADNELGRALKWAENSNLFAGLNEGFFTENKFEADKSLSKQEVVQIVYNYASKKGIVDTNMSNITLNTEVKDADTVAQWAKSSMKWALVNQFVDVDKEQKINPEKEITKEETAKILAMYLDMEERIENERNLLATTPQNTPVSNTENNSTTNDNTTQGSGQTGTETPEIPLTPIEPSTPVEPENPSIPLIPLEPSTPVEKPSIPLIPLEPSIPVEPENPDKPHEHHWVDNIVKIEHPEEGHYEKVLVKDAWDEVIQHEEEGHWEKVLVQDAWDEEVPIYELQWRDICNDCGADITGNTLQHGKDHALNDGTTGGYTTKQVEVQVGTETVHHEAVYEDKWIVDKEAWTEEVVQGQICPDCGATREESEDPEQPHEHHWIDNIVKIEHPEEGHYEKVLIQDAWDEEVPIYEEQIRHICNNCNKDITGNENDHMFEHLANGELAGWHEDVRNVQVGTDIIHHEAVYENKWIVDKEAWTEEVVQGQICPDCGATRK